MPNLEYVGSYTPFDETRGGVEAFTKAVRQQHPGATDREVEQAIQYVLNHRTEKRYPRHIIHRFGMDIMTGDLSQLLAWQWMSPYWQRRLPQFPLIGGALLTGTTLEVQRAAFNAVNPALINRVSLVKPEGLRATYVWRTENDWLQEVSDADAAVLRTAKEDVFRNPERFGRWVEPRSWFGMIHPVGQPYRFNNEDDVHAFERDQLTRQPHWPGAALKQPA